MLASVIVTLDDAEMVETLGTGNIVKDASLETPTDGDKVLYSSLETLDRDVVLVGWLKTLGARLLNASRETLDDGDAILETLGARDTAVDTSLGTPDGDMVLDTSLGTLDDGDRMLCGSLETLDARDMMLVA